MKDLKIEEENNTTSWIYPHSDEIIVQKLINEFNVNEIIAKVLVARGLTSSDDLHHYFYAKLPDLIPPEELECIINATERIKKALLSNESVLIYGDNDVDGITGTALLVDLLGELGGNVFYYVPNRSSLKNTPIMDAIEYASNNNCTLLITVDCGITAASEIFEAKQIDIDVIVTDHHVPTKELPECIATLNPKLIDSRYPNKDLTGVGVAFKLAHALVNQLVSEKKIAQDAIDLKKYLDLVALGTISDMGALIGENRILVRYGLEQLKNTHRIGLRKLMELSLTNTKTLSTIDVASKITPKLNSLGRIDDARKGIELLLLADSRKGSDLAKNLNILNTERQRIERENLKIIEMLIEEEKEEIENNKAIVIISDKLHSGVVAIIASRLIKQYHKPAVVLCIDGDVGKGSLRTIQEFPLIPVLNSMSHYFINYGGHDFAAGITINKENINNFKKSFIEAANKTLTSKDITPKLHIDATVSFKFLTFEFLESLNLLHPYGNGNPQITLHAIAKQLIPPKVISGKHLKLYLEQDGRTLEGIAFNQGFRKEELSNNPCDIEIAFLPQLNVYLNKPSIQLQIKDFRRI